MHAIPVFLRVRCSGASTREDGGPTREDDSKTQTIAKEGMMNSVIRGENRFANDENVDGSGCHGL